MTRSNQTGSRTAKVLSAALIGALLIGPVRVGGISLVKTADAAEKKDSKKKEKKPSANPFDIVSSITGGGGPSIPGVPAGIGIPGVTSAPAVPTRKPGPATGPTEQAEGAGTGAIIGGAAGAAVGAVASKDHGKGAAIGGAAGALAGGLAGYVYGDGVAKAKAENREKIAALDSEAKRLEKLRASYQADNAALKQKIDELNTARAELLADDPKGAKFQSRKASLETEVDKSLTEIDGDLQSAAQKRLSVAADQLAAYDAEIGKLREEKTSLEQQKERLKKLALLN